jgi:hypothetical protein
MNVALFWGALFTPPDPGELAGFVDWLPLFMFCPQVFLPVSLEAMIFHSLYSFTLMFKFHDYFHKITNYYQRY